MSGTSEPENTTLNFLVNGLARSFNAKKKGIAYDYTYFLSQKKESKH
jgi:hypothetical protein